MDLLGEAPKFDIADPSWRIRSRNPIAPPQFIGSDARVVNSLVVSGCEIDGNVENSILSHDVKIAKGAIVKNSIIYACAEIGEGAVVEHAIIDENVKIGKNAVVGEGQKDESLSVAVLGRDITVSDNAVVGAGQIVDEIV